MGRAQRIIALVLSILAASASSSGAQPPPPPPPNFPEFVSLLDNAYNSRNLAAYGSLFHTDVKVYVDGKLVASDRAGLLALIQSEFDQQLHVRTLAWAQGTQILAMENVFGCIPDHIDPHVFYHACPEARAVRYDIASDMKIEGVSILRAHSAWNMHVGSN